MLEQHGVHLPKASLRACRLSGFRRVFCVRMCVRQRKIAKSEAHLIPNPLLNRF